MPTMRRPVITLLTDFGIEDAFVGVMKGVILSLAPEAQLIDLTHRVKPQSIHQAARVLRYSVPYFPPDTIHLVVVDPGVGSQRKPMILQTPDGFFVAPDNGVLTDMLLSAGQFTAVALENQQYWLTDQPSTTFHGRDIFSPAAGHLAAGVPIEAFGTAIENPVVLPRNTFEHISKTQILGEVTYIDHFGDITTNIEPMRWVTNDNVQLTLPAENKALTIDAMSANLTIDDHSFTGIKHTYSDVPVSQPLLLIGSGRELEIAINQGNAQETLGVSIGDSVTFTFTPISTSN